MTENEAREILEVFDRERKEHMVNIPPVPYFDRVACDNFTQSLNIAIEALKEIQKYRSIGTVEECRAAVEKQRAIKPTFEMNYGEFESLFSCECGKKIVVRHNRGVMDNHDGPNYCSKCGKKLDWSDTT